MSTEDLKTKCPTCRQSICQDNTFCPSCKTPVSSDNRDSSTQAAVYNSRGSQNYLSGDGVGSDRSQGTVFKVPFVQGELLDTKYRIIQELDRGGFGAVYEAEDIELNEHIALKVIVDEDGDGRWAGEQLRQYFKQHNQIEDHHHIIKTYDPRCCKYKGLSLILLPMELASGSLRQWLISNPNVKKRRTPALALFQQTCMGMNAMHQAKLVHLDIKPENILIVDGRAKIADFGAGRLEVARSTNDPEQPLPHMIGTAQYMSPEQFKADDWEQIGPASDIYSLGIVLYELLAGVLPFNGTREELQRKHLHDALPKTKGLSDKYWNILSQCLKKNSEERYSDINQLIRDLNRPEKPDIAPSGKSSGILPAIGHGLLWFLKGIFVGLGYLLCWTFKGLFYVVRFVVSVIAAAFFGFIKGVFLGILDRLSGGGRE